jgi:hypothetical protein
MSAAPKVAVFLTKAEVRVLRSLIVAEARRLDPGGDHNYTPQRQWPSKLRRMWPAARKLSDALELFDGVR